MSFVLDAITKSYGATTALAGITLEARGSEFISIVGPSGCGKTTLLKIIAGLVEPSSGRIVFDDRDSRFPTSDFRSDAPGDVERSPGTARPEDGTNRPPLSTPLRTALVFQDHGLLPWYDVLENVALGLRFQDRDRKHALERARHFIVQVGLEKFLHHKPHQLSIGMRQRVGIARAFVADPQILLLDEPFGSLDAQTRLVLQQELLRIWAEHRKLVVHVTHDIDEAILLSDRILVMSGRPARIREEIPIPFARPRTLDAATAAIHRRIWNILEEEVRESLCVPL
ncbi:MAG TPA: ABC transporter ATP-binding protein [Thermoanaerobaculia bacterium]|jgi:NitT/TauT family transport system ATP-binding protein